MHAPNVAGFTAAQANLRKALGTPITFKTPVAPTWPGGTKIDPDTALPYDATIKRANAPFTTAIKTCLIILKQGSPLRPQSDTQSAPVGEMSGMDIIIDLAAEDYADVKAASEVVVNGLEYRIREFKPFGFAGTVYRYLVYGMER